MSDESGVRPKHVLLVGRSLLVLKNAVEMLGERGFRAESTNDFDDITAQFDVTQFDLVVFGGAVPQDRKDQMRAVISRLRPGVIFVQGLAGIPGLIVQQVEGAFAAQRGDGASAPGYDAANRTINFFLEEPAIVTATAWWQTSFAPPEPESDSQVLVSERMSAGEHALALPSEVPEEASFASIQLDQATYTLRLAATG